MILMVERVHVGVWPGRALQMDPSSPEGEGDRVTEMGKEIS